MLERRMLVGGFEGVQFQVTNLHKGGDQGIGVSPQERQSGLFT